MKFPFPLLLTLLAISGFTHAGTLSPPTATALEKKLLLAPARGQDFDSLFAYTSENEGLAPLADRWKTVAESNGPDALAGWILLSLLDVREGRAHEAVDCAEHAAALSPNDLRATAALADALVSAHRAPDAVTALQKALAAESRPEARATLLRQLARTQPLASDDDGALQSWKQLVQEFSADLAALDEAGDAMTDAHRYSAAQSFYETLRAASRAKDYEKFTVTMKLGQLAEIQLDDEAARALYHSALSLSGPGPAGYVVWPVTEAHDRIEDTFRRAGDLPGLAADYEAWLTAHPEDFYAHRRFAEVLCELGRETEAIPSLQKAADAASFFGLDSRLALARRLFEIGKPEDAMAALHQLATAPEPPHTGYVPGPIHDEPERLTSYLNQITRGTGSETAKKSALEQLRRIVPSIRGKLHSVGTAARLLQEQGFGAEALPLFEAVTNLGGEQDKFFYREPWADCLFDLKRDAEASKVLHATVEGPRATSADFLQLARAWRRRGQNADALQTVQAGLDLDPDNFELLSLEWTLFAAANRWEDAANLAPRLLETAPSLASAAQVEDNDAQALRRLGRIRETLQKGAQRLSAGAPVSEIELRRFLALALREESVPDLVRLGLDAAAHLFPDSPALIHDRADFELRQGRIEESNAALERLATLQPAQKAAWLRVIARNDLDSHLPEKAAIAAARAIEADPANRDAYLLAADAELAADHVDTAASILRKAIRVLPSPRDIRLKLAHTFLDADRPNEAAEAYQIAFDANNDASDRLAFVPEMADSYMRAGRLDELIARFRTALRGAEGPWPNMLSGAWPSALYLSEIRFKQGNLAGAREELLKAFGPRSRSVEYLAQSMRIATEQRNASERARLARLHAFANRGMDRNLADHAQIPLLLALAGNGNTDEAMRALEDRQYAFFGDPMLLHDTLGQIAAAGAGPQVASFLRSALSRHADDWRIHFLLAEALLHNGDTDGAEKEFLEVESKPFEAAALPPSTLPETGVDRRPSPFSAGAVVYGSGASGPASAAFSRRILGGFMARQILQQIAAGLDGPSAFGFARFGSGSFEESLGIHLLPKTLSEGADAALVIRSVLAQTQGRAPAFLAQLQSRANLQPRSERVALFALIQALEPLLEELSAEAEHPTGDPALNEICLETLLTLGRGISPLPESVDLDLPRYVPILQTILAREKDPRAILAGQRVLSASLAAAGRFPEARAAAREALDHWDSTPRDEGWDMFGFAMDHSDLDIAEKILARAIDHQRTAQSAYFDPALGNQETKLAKAILAQKPGDNRAAALLSDALQISCKQRNDALSSAPIAAMRSAWHVARVFPFGSSMTDQFQLMEWSEIFEIAKHGRVLPAVEDALNKQGFVAPPAQAASARLARIAFLWWEGRKDKALGETLDLPNAQTCDDLLLLSASMLFELGRSAEAKSALEKMRATSGVDGVDKLVRLLDIAQASKDTEAAKALALKLAALPMSNADQTPLRDVLTEVSLADKAAELAQKDMAQMRAGWASESMRFQEALQKMTQAKDQAGAIAIARRILARPPAALAAISEDFVRTSAINTLRQFQVLPAYIAELEQRPANASASANQLFLLAEACESLDLPKATEIFRHILELEPDNVAWQYRFAGMLARHGKSAEAVGVWETLLSRHPEAASPQNLSIIASAYRSAGQTEQWIKRLLELQKRRPILDRLSPNPSSFIESSLDQIANDLRAGDKLEEAITIWRANMELTRGVPSQRFLAYNTARALVAALVKLDRQEEAAQVLEDYFFPAPPAKLALGYPMRTSNPDWMTQSFSMTGGSSIEGLPMMRLAEPAGAFERLRAKAMAMAAARPGGPESLLVLMIDILHSAGATTLEGEFDTALHGPKDPLSASQNSRAAASLQAAAPIDLPGLSFFPTWEPALRALVAALSQRYYPQLALDLENRIPEPLSLYHGDKYLREARLCLALGRRGGARAALDEWNVCHDRAAWGLERLLVARELSGVDLMLQAGMDSEASALLDRLHLDIETRSSRGLRRKMDALTDRLEFLKGQAAAARIVIWTSPRTPESRTTTVSWEISPASVSENHANPRNIATAPGSNGRRSTRSNAPKKLAPIQSVALASEDLSRLDGKYTVELYRGSGAEDLQLLATIPAAKMRGAWESPEPLESGDIIGIVRYEDTMALSQATLIPGGVNLVANPDFLLPPIYSKSRIPIIIPGWSALLAADVAQPRGGPNGRGIFTRLGILQLPGRENVVATPIPIEPNKGYVFSSWLRASGENARVGLTGKFLDKDRKPLLELSPIFVDVADQWTACSFQLLPADGHSPRNQPPSQIPRQAAFFEPRIITGSPFGGGSYCDLHELYFGEITSAPAP